MSQSMQLDMSQASWIVQDLVEVINANRQYLSEVDGAIGDGDHGINMSKGFTRCGDALAQLGPISLGDACENMAHVLLEGIGGSMGPLYGSFFMEFGATLRTSQYLDAALFAKALAAGSEAVQSIGDARIGDKTLMDTLLPAQAAFELALASGQTFIACLQAMSSAAETGKESTRALRARIGRAARLGDRSIGVLDAGACSCCLILQGLAAGIGKLAEKQETARPL